VMGDLQRAFEQTVRACRADGVATAQDAGLLQAGRTIAKQIDRAVREGEGAEVTKALYLMPHLLNIMREMLATPATRRAVKTAALPPSQLARLRTLVPKPSDDIPRPATSSPRRPRRSAS
jgi:hypothetical protein